MNHAIQITIKNEAVRMEDEHVARRLNALEKLEKRIEGIGKANKLPKNKEDIIKERVSHGVLSDIIRDIRMEVHPLEEDTPVIERTAREHHLMFKALVKEGFTVNQAIVLMSAMIGGSGPRPPGCDMECGCG